MAAVAECARTREVVKVLEILSADLKEAPLQGEHDPRLAIAFEVALYGDDSEFEQRPGRDSRSTPYPRRTARGHRAEREPTPRVPRTAT